MVDEQKLIDGLRQRDADAFKQLFDLYSDKIYRLAVGLLQNEVEADGVVQDAFLRLFERIDQFEGRAKLGTYLYRIAYNLCQDRLRKRKNNASFEKIIDEDGDLPMPKSYLDWAETPMSLLTAAELSEQIKQAVDQLPHRLKSVFILREIEGLSSAETATTLDITLSNAKVRLHRARLHMRETLSAYFSELVQTKKS